MIKKILSFFKVERDLFEEMVRESYEDFSSEEFNLFLKFKRENSFEYGEIRKIVEESSEDERFKMVTKFNLQRSGYSVGNGSYRSFSLPDIGMTVRVFANRKVTLSIRRLK